MKRKELSQTQATALQYTQILCFNQMELITYKRTQHKNGSIVLHTVHTLLKCNATVCLFHSHLSFTFRIVFSVLSCRSIYITLSIHVNMIRNTFWSFSMDFPFRIHEYCEWMVKTREENIEQYIRTRTLIRFFYISFVFAPETTISDEPKYRLIVHLTVFASNIHPFRYWK